jgi:hypothetical protein
MEDVVLKVPKEHDTLATKTEIRIWEREVDIFVRQRETYHNKKCALYSVVWEQCSGAMQAKIKSDNDFDNMPKNSDSLALINVMKGIAYKFDSQKNIYLALDNVKLAFYSYHQGTKETNANYMSKFNNTIEVIERYGGKIGEDNELVMEELKIELDRTVQECLDNASPEVVKVAIEAAKSKAHAIAFLKRAAKNRYGHLVT